MNIITRLQKLSLLVNLKEDADALKKIAAIVKPERFPAKSYIIKENDDGEQMFILNKGTVRVEKDTLSKDRFTVVNLKDEMNIFFGELALLDSDSRSASVYAVTDVECYVIKKNDFERLCVDDPRIGYYIIKEMAKSLSTRLRKMTVNNVNLIAALVYDDQPG